MKISLSSLVRIRLYIMPAFRSLWLASLVALLMTSGVAWSGLPKEPLPADLLEQWNQIQKQNPDTGKISDLLAEGKLIIQRLQELDELRRDPRSSLGEDFDQRVEKLQERFKDLLLRIEMARISTLPRDEIEAMRDHYLAEQRCLEAETRAHEDSVLARGERFLDTYKQNIAFKYYTSKQEMIVDFLYRLAEIYFQRGQDEFFRTNEVSAFKPALEKYQRIIDEFPASEYVDDALYNIAYIKNNSLNPDDRQEAITHYQTLIAKYGNSPFVPEAYWRVGEYYFCQSPPQIAEAIANYNHLLSYPDTHWYARGLYKIGWCHFRNSDYPLAVEYFTRTVESSMDSTRIAEDVLFASMMDEAIEYISVCYAQDEAEWSESGVASVLSFVESDSLRRATYGRKVLEYLGNIYKFQVGKYPQAIEAYQAFLQLYPMDPKAPWVQEKIVNCFAVNMREFGKAYAEKDRMFDLYRAGTEWDAANPDSTLRADADVIIEKYYFENINEKLGRAIELNDRAMVEQAVQMSRNYLETFPAGPNAYTVNFNLAVLLDHNIADNQQAYTEYIKVSKDYAEDKHRREAAVSAVVIAQKMIAEQGQVLPDSIKGTELTEAEQKYVDAADNYLTLFPQGEEAPIFLLGAGGIYYNHGLYEDSRKYYSRLLTDFEAGDKLAEAYKFLMNGYFAEGNYLEAERVAREIQTIGFDSTLVASAKIRQAESIFLNAQGLKQQAQQKIAEEAGSSPDTAWKQDFLAAANEYKRAALERPDYDQADKALFEAGLAYQQAKAWTEANEVYLILAERYPQSPQADKSLYNVAYNCQAEIGDKATAASTFERLARDYPESKLAQDALRNSSINYVEAQDWAGAIRANSAYIQMFPQAPDANLFLFENAGLYLKLGDEVSADQIYADYAKRYPNDPRTVRAHWERGQYLQEKGRSTEALTEFNAGIQAHRNLVAAGSVGEETYASRCLVEVIYADLAAYESIQFAPASAVDAKKREKLARRDHIMAELEELNHLAKDEMFEGLYSVGKVDENLSLAFEHQELPEKGKEEEKILTRETANQDAIEIAQRAMAAYHKAADDMAAALNVLTAEKEQITLRQAALSDWLIAAQKSDSLPPDLPDSTAMLGTLDRGLQEVNAAIEKGNSWIRRAEDKIPELALRNAEIKFSTVRAFLALPDVGKNEDLRMPYRFAVLSEFAAPRAAEVIRLYRLAIQESDSGEMAADWKNKAENGVIDLSRALEKEYRDLNERVLNLYTQNYSVYEDLLSKGEGATTRKGQEAADIAEKLVLYSDQSYEYAVGALAAQAELLNAVAEGEEIGLEVRSLLTASAIEEAFRIDERYDALSTQAGASKEVANGRQGESVVWEDASMTFEDCAYNFTRHEEELLSSVYDFNQGHGADEALAQRIAWALVGLNREKYLSLLAPFGQEAWVKSDESFRVYPSYQSQWETVEFSDADWFKPRVIKTDKVAEEELSGCKAIWLESKSDTLVYDSLYVRKTFDIEQEPVAGDIWVCMHSGFALQLNGEFVGAVEPGENPEGLVHYDVSESLHKGRNAIALLALDTNGNVESSGVMICLKYKVVSDQSMSWRKGP